MRPRSPVFVLAPPGRGDAVQLGMRAVEASIAQPATVVAAGAEGTGGKCVGQVREVRVAAAALPAHTRRTRTSQR